MDDDNYIENDDHDASLESKIEDSKLEYGIDLEDEPLKQKNLALPL